VAPNVLHIRVATATYLDAHDPRHVTIAAKLQRHHFHNVAQVVHFTCYRHCTVANLNSAPTSAYNKDVKHSTNADDHTDPCGLAGCSAYLLQATGFDYTMASAFFAHRLVAAVLDVLLGNSPCMAAANCSKLHHISLELAAHALALDSFLVVQVASVTSAWGINAVVDCYCQDRRTYGLRVVADCRVAADYFGYCYCCAFFKNE